MCGTVPVLFKERTTLSAMKQRKKMLKGFPEAKNMQLYIFLNKNASRVLTQSLSILGCAGLNK
jgi:hypothetical protein